MKLFKTIYGVQKEHGWWYAVEKKTFLGVCYSTKYISEAGVVAMEFEKFTFCACYTIEKAKGLVPKYLDYKNKIYKQDLDNEGFKEVS